jgi:hypothetical protein
MKTFLLILLLFCSVLAATTYTDNFTRSNANPIGGNWTQAKGNGLNAQLISNRVTSTGEDFGCAYWNANVFSDSQTSAIIYRQSTVDVYGVAFAAARISSDTNTYYAYGKNASVGHHYLYRVIRGTFTAIGDNSSEPDLATGDTLTIKCFGDSIFGYTNSTLRVAVKDTFIHSGYAGLSIRSRDTYTDSISFWIGGNYAAAACDTPHVSWTKQIDTVGVAMSQTATKTGTMDSAKIVSGPSGLSMNLTTGALTGTHTDSLAQTIYKVRYWGCSGAYVDSSYDTLTFIWGPVKCDSIRPTHVNWADTIKVYGRGYGNTQGSSTISMGDSTPTVTSWTNTLIKFLCPQLVSGEYKFYLVGPSNTDSSKVDSVLHTTQFTLTMAAAQGGTTVPSVGANTVDSNVATSISHTAPTYWVFQKWTRSGINATIADSGTNSTTATLKGNATVTANDTLAKYTATMACANGTTTPTVGAHSVDTTTFTITCVPAMGYRFSSWAAATGVTYGNANANPTTCKVTQNATVTANVTIVQYTLTMVNSTPAGTISPTTGASSHDTAANFNLTFENPVGYRFWKWTRNNASVHIADSSLASTTAHLHGNGTITAFDSIIHFTLTVTQPAHGSITPATGLVDSNASTAITHSLGAGWLFKNWATTGGILGNANTNPTTIAIKANATLSVVDTSDPSVPAKITWAATVAPAQFGDAASWDLGRVPGALDSAYFTAAAVQPCSILTVRRVAKINESAGLLYFGAQRDTVGILTVTGGTLENAGDTLVLLGDVSTASAATMTSTAPTLWKITKDGAQCGVNGLTWPTTIFSGSATLTSTANTAGTFPYFDFASAATDTGTFPAGKLLTCTACDAASFNGANGQFMVYLSSQAGVQDSIANPADLHFSRTKWRDTHAKTRTYINDGTNVNLGNLK